MEILFFVSAALLRNSREPTNIMTALMLLRNNWHVKRMIFLKNGMSIKLDLLKIDDEKKDQKDQKTLKAN